VVAICSNDVDAFPEDSFDEMAKRAEGRSNAAVPPRRAGCLLAGRQPALAETPPQGYFLACRAKAPIRLESMFAVSGAPFQLK